MRRQRQERTETTAVEPAGDSAAGEDRDAPAIVLTCARSGSRLLRFILGTPPPLTRRLASHRALLVRAPRTPASA